MSRTPWRPFAGALVAALCALPLLAGDVDKERSNALIVQVALEKGLAYMKAGHYAEAVAVLDKHVSLIDGNRAYLLALRDAYRGHVKDLETAGRLEDAKRYRAFLDILDPQGSARPAPVLASVAPPEKRPDADVGRGKTDDDPFGDSNQPLDARGRSAVAQAETEFNAKNYEQAAKLYARAERVCPGCTDGAKERWGYCRLYAAAQQLKKPNASGPELDAEIRSAMAMSPRLADFGRKLLAVSRETPTAVVAGSAAAPEDASVEVKHTRVSGWNVAETANFRVFHAVGRDTAEAMARKAESTRTAMSRKWFGDDPAAWSPRCDIFIHPQGDGYAKATGAPAEAPGHATISMDGGRVSVRRVDLRGNYAALMNGTLPHETTHVVIAGRFGTHHVPRWADEGMAVLSEPQDRVQMHLRNLPTHQRDGTLIPLAKLVLMKDYPEPRFIGAFYAQSVSLVDFLTRKKDAPTFARFLREGLDEGGYAPALRRHYGYENFAALEAEWKAAVFGGATVTEKARAGR